MKLPGKCEREEFTKKRPVQNQSVLLWKGDKYCYKGEYQKQEDSQEKMMIRLWKMSKILLVFF